MVNRKNRIKAVCAPGQSLKATAHILRARLAPSGDQLGRDAENWLIGRYMARGYTREQAIAKVMA